MNENPYQSPSTDSQLAGIHNAAAGDLRRVGVYQKGIIICILLYFVLGIAQAFIVPSVPADARLIVSIATRLCVLGLFLTATVFVVLLAMKVYSPVLGVVLGVFTLVRCIGLIVLFLVNGKATKVLKQNGIKVGFFGADLSQV